MKRVPLRELMEQDSQQKWFNWVNLGCNPVPEFKPAAWTKQVPSIKMITLAVNIVCNNWRTTP